ncbi:unnamed protein product [Durusdinium trenchii]|uniref:Uncharacterized protein n=1 Tax=Durusdinium trenchii TaxID=1381693 RepID=A0ABP0HSM5_9DINO
MGWKAPSRSWSPEERSDTDAQAAILLQAHWRGTMVRRLHRKHLVSAAVLVAHLRAWHMGRQERKCFLRLKAAVLRLQRFLRERRSFQTEEELMTSEMLVSCEVGPEIIEVMTEGTEGMSATVKPGGCYVRPALRGAARRKLLGEEVTLPGVRSPEGRAARRTPRKSCGPTPEKKTRNEADGAPGAEASSWAGCCSWERFSDLVSNMNIPMELQERARRLLRALDATLGSAKGVDGCPLGMEQQENAQQGMEEDLPLNHDGRLSVEECIDLKDGTWLFPDEESFEEVLDDTDRKFVDADRLWSLISDRLSNDASGEEWLRSQYRLLRSRRGEANWSPVASKTFTGSKSLVWSKSLSPAGSLESFWEDFCGVTWPRGTDVAWALVFVAVGLDGEALPLDLLPNATGREVYRALTERLPLKEGARVCVQIGREKISLRKAVKDYGLESGSYVGYVYVPVNLHEAWRYLQGWPVDDEEFTLEGVTQLGGVPSVESLPSSLTELILHPDFNQSLEKVLWPGSLQSLSFGFSFNQTLEGTIWPNQLRSLTFGAEFNQHLDEWALPSSLESLTFGIGFNRSLDHVSLPDGLKHLTFGTFFNKSLEQVHLPELESLVFGMKFDQSLEEVVLPGTLQHLAFGDGFNQPLDHVILPEGLLSLTFGNHFNQSLEAVLLPSSLKSLTFGNHFNQSLESLPFPSLENLTFGAGFVESLDRIHLPSSLQSLTLGLLQEVDGVTLPDRLKSLTFGDYFDQTLESVSLPESLQELSFGYDFNRSLRGVTLPSGLRSLTFGTEFNQGLDGVTLPKSLQSLTFGAEFNRGLEGATLPESLQRLTFSDDFNQSLDRVVWPSSLHHLTFGKEFNQALEGTTLPSALESLTFGASFNQNLDAVRLPAGLRSLNFGDGFNQSLDLVSLPSGLQSLSFGQSFKQRLDRVIFPPALRSLTCRDHVEEILEGILEKG